MSYFITGINTGVGKTLISCALLHAFSGQGKRVAGFKPVAAGCDENEHNDDAKRLRAASSMQLTYGQVNPYCFHHAIAPHLAAMHSGVRIELSRILASYHELSAQSDEVIVEGSLAKDGTKQGNARSVTMAGTGKKLGGASSEGNIP